MITPDLNSNVLDGLVDGLIEYIKSIRKIDARERSRPGRMASICNQRKPRHLKPTYAKRRWIQEKILLYSSQIGIRVQDIPTPIFTRKEYIESTADEIRSGRTRTHKILALICFKKKYIFINVKKHSSLKELQDTIIHELVHYRFRYLNHGKACERRIRNILNGKRYPKVELSHQLSNTESVHHETQIGCSRNDRT